MQKKIYRVILITVAAAVCLFAAAGTYISYYFYRGAAREELAAVGRLIAAEKLDPKEAANRLEDALPYPVRLTYIDYDGSVVFDSSGSVSENHAKRHEVMQAMSEGEGFDTRVSETLGTSLYYFCVKTDTGLIRLSREYSNIAHIALVMIPVMAAAAGIILILATVVSVMLASKLTEPISELTKQIEDVNFHSPRPSTITTDCEELVPIAESTTAMAKQISGHLKEVERTSEIRREFTANVSHELKTPLTTIRGFADMLRSGVVNDGEEVKRSAELIYSESERLLSLINDIIELSRVEENTAKQLESTRLDTLAEEVVYLMREKAVENDIHLHLKAQPVTAMVNAGYIKEMLINLTDNAIKYNKPDGNVWISIDKNSNDAIITVEDDGIGIAKEDRERVFERFYRADKGRGRSGTGLGLSIVKHIAAYHDGQIVMQSNPGDGTAVTVKIPGVIS
ncbi:MAG: ATP-binding protein [Clostridiales bacterium]|nr:ATP-binding protein [Clostridiales bacterium]